MEIKNPTRDWPFKSLFVPCAVLGTNVTYGERLESFVISIFSQLQLKLIHVNISYNESVIGTVKRVMDLCCEGFCTEKTLKYYFYMDIEMQRMVKPDYIQRVTGYANSLYLNAVSGPGRLYKKYVMVVSILDYTLDSGPWFKTVPFDIEKAKQDKIIHVIIQLPLFNCFISDTKMVKELEDNILYQWLLIIGVHLFEKPEDKKGIIKVKITENYHSLLSKEVESALIILEGLCKNSTVVDGEIKCFYKKLNKGKIEKKPKKKK